MSPPTAKSSTDVKRFFAGVGAVFAMLIAVLAINTARLPSKQSAPGPADTTAIDADAIAARLGGALRYPTISVRDEPTGNDLAIRPIDGLIGYLEASYPRVHAALPHERVRNGIVFSWNADAPGKPILLTSHLDVVPVEEGTEAQWTHAPFAGEIADGFVWGRGTLDDKIGVIAILEAVDSLLAQGYAPSRPVWLAFGADEEVGGNDAKAMAAHFAAKGVRFEFVLDEGLAILEGQLPGVTKRVAMFAVAEKGYADLELAAKGAGGHSSMPPKDTATAVLASALVRLGDHPMPGALQGPVRETLETLAPEMRLAHRIALSNLWLFAPVVKRTFEAKPATNASLRTSMAVTMLKGSPKDNVLAQRATAVVNVRLFPGDTGAEVLEHARRVIADERVELRFLDGFSSEASAVSPSSGPAWDLLARAARSSLGDVLVAPGLTLGATDARHYSNVADAAYRFAPLVMRPEDNVRVHGTDERISVENCGLAVRFYRRVITEAGGAAP